MKAHKVDDELLNHLDTLIKNYEIDSAKELLSKLIIKEVPTNKRAPLARLARRAGQFSMGVKLLNENVIDKSNPKQEDLVEYIGCIRRLGMINQSLQLLERVEPTAEALLNEAFCHIQKWDYKKSTEVLRDLKDNHKLNETQKRVVETNYIAGLEAINDLDRAYEHLIPFLEDVKSDYSHLYLNGINLKGKIQFKKGDYGACIQTLEEALKLGGDSNFHYSLLVQKWLWLAKIYSGETNSEDQEFKVFLAKVRENKVWEILRDLDWRVGKISKDEKLIKNSYFGTPFESFKKMIIEETGLIFEKSFIRKGLDKNENAPIDLLSTALTGFPYGKELHRLLLILSSDFYQPWSVFRIFTYLYPNEVYDPGQSQNKVYRLIGRLEKALASLKLQDCLESTTEGYRLRPFKSERFTIYDKMVFDTKESLFAYKLSIENLDQGFDSNDIRKALNLSQSQMYRTVKALAESGHIENLPNSSTIYKLNI